jgi:hypothetical protein
MHVDVDAPRIEIEPQDIRRHALVMQNVAIRFAQRMREHAIAHEAAVDERVLRVAALRRERRPHRKAGETHARRFDVDERRMDDERVGEQRFDARSPATRDQALGDAPVVLQRQPDFRMAERDAPKRFVAMRPLGAFGAQEFAPRRRVEIKLLDRNGRSRRQRCRRDGTDRAAFDFDPPCVWLAFRARCEREARHGGDRRERLPAKAQRRDRFKISDRGDLRRRMPRDRERQILALDARAVVGHPQPLDAAARDVDVDLRRAGIETVLEQLLQRRSRPLDDFAGSDLIDQEIG